MNITSGSTALPTTVRVAHTTSPTSSTPILPKPTGLAVAMEAVLDTGFFLANEVVELGKNDPALALRLGATTISGRLLEGTGDSVSGGFANAIIPTIRTAILGANAYRLHETWKDPGSSKWEKGLDVARVATDLVGLAGSIMQVAGSSLGGSMVGFSYAVDTVSHAVRGISHTGDRMKVWQKQFAERKAAKAKELPTPPASVNAPLLMS